MIYFDKVFSRGGKQEYIDHEKKTYDHAGY